MLTYIKLDTSVIVVDNIKPENRLENVLVYPNTTYFNYCFPKNNNNLKEIFNSWDILINDSINEGHSHFSFTINLTEQILIEEYTKILTMHPIEIPLEDISQEDYGKTNYDKYLSLQHNLHFYRLDINGSIPYYLDTIISYSRGVSWLFLTTEENKQGVLHFHGIFAVKNLIDYNKPIAINLTQELKKKYKNIDILIKPLNHFIDIKK